MQLLITRQTHRSVFILQSSWPILTEINSVAWIHVPEALHVLVGHELLSSIVRLFKRTVNVSVGAV
jgi:hypothetical protein